MEVVNTVVVPGFSVPATTLCPGESRIVIGNGLVQNRDQITVTKTGILRQSPAKYWVESNQRRYVPVLEDMVIGVVTEKHSESYKLDIGSAHPATLSSIDFEGATKRNRPNIAIGALVYCRVIIADKDVEPEVTCISTTNRHGWMTGQSTFGELKSGFVVKCDQQLALSLMSPSCAVLEVLGGRFAFEISVGMNGRIWVKSKRPKTTIIVIRAILDSVGKSKDDIMILVQRLCEHFTVINDDANDDMEIDENLK
eukprot:c8152_g2_i2.p1 GENE.c8152_g2_i2~~c8152_g2_i2.p1  ORF type:complete len:254 (-),score=58.46 c8152_g2_i2:21-782(-)